LFSGFGEYEYSLFGDFLGMMGLQEGGREGLLRDHFVGTVIPYSIGKNVWLEIAKQAGYTGTEVEGFGNYILQTWKSGNWTQIALMVGGCATAIATLGGITSGLISALAKIPVVGWIAIGVIAGVSAMILSTYLVSAILGKSFRVGFNIKTGIFGIPTGFAFVCETL